MPVPRWRILDDMDFDVLIIGSGFGGSTTALRLTEKGYRVGVLEAGRRFADHEFAKTSWRLRDFVGTGAGLLRNPAHQSPAQRPYLGRRGCRRRFTELCEHPLRAAGPVLQRQTVVAYHRLARRTHAALRPGDPDARVVKNPTFTDADRIMKDLADEMGWGHLHRHPGRGVFRRRRAETTERRCRTRSSGCRPARTGASSAEVYDRLSARSQKRW